MKVLEFVLAAVLVAVLIGAFAYGVFSFAAETHRVIEAGLNNLPYYSGM